ncbi:MAG: protein kinase, partial [Phycisphaerales bacterium]
MKPARETLGPSMDIDPVLAELVDEITNRIQAGESADLSRYAREHPEQMEQLQKLLPAIEVLAELKDSTAAQTAPAQPVGRDTHLQEGVLGDYRIVREIGRGGMGVVYEAEQISLGRKVALKVLPFAAVLDQRQLHRFKNEAQAAAQLHHSNIVPVHSVGCERGVHYYAMQYIEGQTLGAVIGELRHVSGLDEVEPDELPHPASEQTRSLAAGRWAPGKGSSGAGGLPTPTP